MVKNDDNQNEGGSIYEVGYLIASSLSSEQVPAEVEKIHNFIKKEGGTIIAEEEPKLRDLAYTVERTFANKKTKHDSAYFGWVKFELDSSLINGIDAKLKGEESVIRFLLISTIRENTLISKRPARSVDGAKRRGEKDAEMSEEEIEKTIETLVAE